MADRIARAPAVLAIAKDLGWTRHKDNPVDFVVGYCRAKIEEWAHSFEPANLEDLLAVVETKIGLLVERITDDVELGVVCEKYADTGEDSFRLLPRELDDDTHGCLVRLRRPRNGCTHVAVIDCRGAKWSRRWFSTWHEIAHLLTTPQLEFSFRRCTEDSKDPVEVLMDRIAAELAFFDGLFGRPAELSLPALEQHRLESAPDSSREASYLAAVKNDERPCLLLVVERAHRAADRRALATGQLFPDLAPLPELRATKVFRSAGARDTGLNVHRNMRIPAESVITRAFEDDGADLSERTSTASENLDWWRTSDGKVMPSQPIQIEVGRSGHGRMFALVLSESDGR